MIIYGVALLAACSLAGMFLGELLGHLCQIEANVGGVGFSMLLLMAASRWIRPDTPAGAEAAAGIRFWAAMYVPIVVAMAASQNVYAAVASGPVALAAGLSAVGVGFALVAVLGRLGRTDASMPADSETQP